MTLDYQETFDRISIYFLAILISPILFGAIPALYLNLLYQDSWSYGPTVFVAAIYSFPFFLFGAFPVSLYTDFSVRTKNASRWAKALIYAGSGSLAGLLVSIILYDLFSIIYLMILGMFGGIIHFSVLALLKKVIK